MSDIASHSKVEIGSERSFGLVFAAVFMIIALWPLVIHGNPVRLWAIAIAAVFLAAAFFAQPLLKPLNKIWFKFGMLLSMIVSPIVMGIIFFVTVTPIGLIRRLKNPDPLKQKFDGDADSYWIVREASSSDSMRKQF